MAETNSGCMSPITFIFVMVSTFITAVLNFGLSSQPVIEPPPNAVPTIEIVLATTETDLTPEQLDQAYTVLDQRLTALLNTGEISVYELETSPNDEIIVRVDQTDATETALISVLTTPGYLEFADFSSVPTEALATYQETIIVTTDSLNRVPASDNQDIFPTILTYDAVASAETFVDDFGNIAIQINLTEDGATTLETFTENNTGIGLAIVLDNRVLTVPIIQSRISSPVILSGLFNESEATSLAVQLNTQPLPFALEVASMTTIQP